MDSSVDHWVDVLTPRRHTSDFLWITLHQWKCSQNKYSKNRSPEEIREDVYNEPIIKSLIGRNPRLRTRVEKILTEMSEDFSIKSVRFVGYFLIKIMKSIYSGVYVNNELVLNSDSLYFEKSLTSSLSQTLNNLAKESPILYVPTHRSYADFLIFSFICFSLDIPLPSIAAGIDFLALNQIASLLRSCGAFFIRRSFKNSSDNLYWHVFRAYLQNMIRGSERPIEFFIEGTRSRNGKSLFPRTGLLSVALELFFTGQIPDLIIIPVSISYDRVLEEGLYSKELLPSGDYVGKPAETPRHLWSGAKAILSQNFGSVYIRFCQPISVRELSEAQDLRLCHTLDSKCDPNLVQSTEERDFVLNLSKSILKAQQMSAVYSPFTFASLIFLTYFESNEESIVSIPIRQLAQDIEALSSLLNTRNLSTSLWQKPLIDELYQSFDIHSNVVKLSEDKNSVIIDSSDQTVRLHFQQYANHCMQLLIDFAIFLYSSGDPNKFQRIKWFLSREFIHKTSEINDSYILAQFLSRIPLTERIEKVLIFQIKYYMKNYLSITEWLAQHKSSYSNPIDMKGLVKAVQIDLCLSSDLIQNCFTILSATNALLKDSENKLTVSASHLVEVTNELIQLSDTQSESSFSYPNFKLKANL